MMEWKRGMGVLAVALLGAVLVAGPEPAYQLQAADAPLDPAAQQPMPVYQEDPLDAPEVYERRLLQLAAGTQPASALERASLQYNAALAWRAVDQPRRALSHCKALCDLVPGDFNFRCLYVEMLGRIGLTEAAITPEIMDLVQRAGSSTARQVRVVKLIEGLPESSRPLKLAGDVAEKGLAEAEAAHNWDGFWGWMQIEDERLALERNTPLRLKLWEYPLRRTMPLGRLHLREAQSRIFALEDRELIRVRAQAFWETQVQDPRADWPADASPSAALDRAVCFRESLEWMDPNADPRAVFEHLPQTYVELVLACAGSDRLTAFHQCTDWLDKLAASAPMLSSSLEDVRRSLCEKLIADPKASGPELLAAADGLLACLHVDVDSDALAPVAETKVSRNDVLAERVFALVKAYDRADKAGCASGTRGLQAVLYAIRISGEDPDMKLDRAPRYFVLYDYVRLLSGKTTADEKAAATEAARLFVEFKATKMPRWQAAQEILALAAKHHAPAETLAALIEQNAWPIEATVEMETALAALQPEYGRDPRFAVAAATRMLERDRWNSAAMFLQPLSELKPSGPFSADVETAQALLKVNALADRLPAEVEAVLVAAMTIAPIDSYTRNDAAQALVNLQYAQGELSQASATLQAWWDPSATAQALRAAALARVKMTLVQEHDLDAAQALYAALRRRLPGDPVSRLTVLKEILRALADGGEMTGYRALVKTELADATLPATVRVDLLNVVADEALVQGDWAVALTQRAAAYAEASKGDLRLPGMLNPTTARAAYLRGILDRMQGDVAKFPQAGNMYEKLLLGLLDAPAAEPVAGRDLCAWYTAQHHADKAAALIKRLADERPWDLSLAAEAARACLDAGDKAAAMQRYQAALAVQSDDPDLLFNLLRLALQTGDTAVSRTLYSRLHDLPGTVPMVDYTAQLVALGQTDLGLTLLSDREQARGHMDRDEMRYLTGYWIANGHLDRAVQVLAQFALRRARENRTIDPPSLVGDLPGIIAGWDLNVVDADALPSLIERAEGSLLPAPSATAGAHPLVQGPAEHAAAWELRLCRVGLLVEAGNISAALALCDVSVEAEFDRLTSHLRGNPQFVAGLCEKGLVTPPVGNPGYEIKLHRTLAQAYEQAGDRAKVLTPYAWLVDHCKATEKRDWQEHYARLLLGQGRWQDALNLYLPIAQAGQSAPSAAAVWRILRDHPDAVVGTEGKPVSADAFLLNLATGLGTARRNAPFHRELGQRMSSEGNLTVAETLARLVLAEDRPEDREQDRTALIGLLTSQKNDAGILALCDAEATVLEHRQGLEALLPQYLNRLEVTHRYTRDAILQSPFLQNLPPNVVWAALVQDNAVDADHWATFLDLGLAHTTASNAEFYTAQLKFGAVDEALQALLEAQAVNAAPEHWDLFQQPDGRQADVAHILEPWIPELSAVIEEHRAKVLTLGTLDGAKAALHRAELLSNLGQLKAAEQVYASLTLDDPAPADRQLRFRIPASLQETVRGRYFQFLMTRRCDLQQAATLLPSQRRPGSLALRQAIWNTWRANGSFRECLKDVDAAMKAESLREMPDVIRRNMILDLLGAAVDLGNLASPSSGADLPAGSTGAAGNTATGAGGGGRPAPQFRSQAFQLALEALRRSELATRRGGAVGDEGDQSIGQWLYLLINISRYDTAQRADLNALLWNLAQSEPAGQDRIARAILTVAGDEENAAARLTVVEKLIELHPGPQFFKTYRLELLRQLERPEEVLVALREPLAAAPDDLEALYTLARELSTSDQPPLQAEGDRLFAKILSKLDAANPELLTSWAQRLESDGCSSPAHTLFRMACMASPEAAYAQTYAQILRDNVRYDEAAQVLLQALFVREWRAKEGQARYQAMGLPMFGDSFNEIFNNTDACAAAAPALNDALHTAVSPRHRAEIFSALFVAQATLDQRSAALASLDAALAEEFPQRVPFSQALLARLSNFRWDKEAALLAWKLARQTPASPDYLMHLDAAIQMLQNTEQRAEAIEALKLRIAATLKPEETSLLQSRLGTLLHELHQDEAARKAFAAAQAVGAPLHRYNAWTSWKKYFRDDNKAEDCAATQTEFAGWATQMETLSDRLTVRQDFRAWLEAHNRLPDLETVLQQLLADQPPTQRGTQRMQYVQLLIKLNRVPEAMEQIKLGLKEQSLNYYSMRSVFQSLFKNMNGPQIADWVDTRFQSLDLPWNLQVSMLSSFVNDYTLRQQAIARLAELNLARNPADRTILAQGLNDLCSTGEYDRAFRMVDQALAAVPAPAAGATGGHRRRQLAVWLQGILNQNNCREQALQRLDELRQADAPHGWNRAQADLMRADLSLTAGHADEAVSVWTELRNDPKGFSTFRTQARQALFRYQLNWLRDGAAAEKIYRDCLSEDPRDPAALAMLGQLVQLYRDQARNDKCLELLETRLQAGALTPTERDDLLLTLAQTRLEILTADNAEPSTAMVEPVFQVFSRAYLRLNRNAAPAGGDSLFNRSRTLLVQIWSRGKTSAPWRVYEPRLQALADQERPNSAPISDLRLEVFRLREERERVADELSRRYKRDPANLDLHNRLVQAYVEARQFTEAANLLKADLAARPKDHRPAFALVDLYLAADKKTEAAAAWEVAVKLAPEEAVELTRLGEHYEERRRYEWALELYRRAQRLQPSLSAADNLARVGERLEQPLESVKIYLAYYEGMFRGTNWVHSPVDFSLAERITPYARNERDFDAAVALVETARGNASQATHRAFLTVVLAELQALRRRQSAALDLYKQAFTGDGNGSMSGVFAGKSDLLLYLLGRLPVHNAAETARAMARSAIADPLFARKYDFGEQRALVEAYTAAAGADQDVAEVDGAWQRLLADAPADQRLSLTLIFAERLSARHDAKTACALLEQVLHEELQNDQRIQILSMEVNDWEQEKKTREAALCGDRLCRFCALINNGQLPELLARNVERWLNVPDVAAGQALLKAVVAEPACTEDLRRACFTAVFNRLQSRNPKEDLSTMLDALGAFLPPDQTWKLVLFQARRLGISEQERALALIEKLKPTLATDDAQAQALDAQIAILTANKRYGQAANLWRDALIASDNHLPRGKERLIQLYVMAERWDAAMQQCIEILGGTDIDLTRRISNEIRQIGYGVQSLRDPVKHKAFGPLAEATLATQDPDVISAACDVWMEMLKEDRRTDDLLDFANRTAAAIPVSSYQRRSVLDQAANRIYQILFYDQYKTWPRPAPSRVLEMFKQGLLPALEQANYQPSQSYTTQILQQMHLEPQMAALIATAAADRIRETARPIAVSKRAGDLINLIVSSQRDMAAVQWQAALNAGSPSRTELLRDLRDAAQARNDFAGALTFQTSLLQLEPWNFEYRTSLAALLTRLNRSTEADTAWQQAGKLAESSEDQLYTLAESMRSVNRFTGAVDMYKDAYDLAKRRGSLNSSRRASIVAGLTRTEWALNDQEQAFKYWSDGMARIARRDYNRENLMNGLVELLTASPNLPAIIAAYEKDGRPSGLENANLRDAFGRAWQQKSYNLSDEASRRGMEELALLNLSIAADLLPQEPRLRERMIEIYNRRDDKLSMIAQYRELSRNDPKNIDYYEKMGYLYKDRRQPAEQEKAWSMILEALPREGAGHRRLAEIYLREKQYPRALAEAQAVIDNRPEDPASYVLHAQMLVRNSRFAEAEAEFTVKVLGHADEWHAKRYWDNEWKTPAEQGLIDMYAIWIRERLTANDTATATQIRDRAHHQPAVVNQLRGQLLPVRENNEPAEDWRARVNAWQFLRENLPAPEKSPLEIDPEMINQVEG